MEDILKEPIEKVGDYIPEISDERLLELFEKIRPVVMFEDREMHFLLIPPNQNGSRRSLMDYLRRTAYLWTPIKGSPSDNLEALIEIKTYHAYGYQGFFKPSIAEIFAQIPEDILQNVSAFEIIKSPNSFEDFLEEDGSTTAFDIGLHWATTRFYKKT